MKANAMQSSGKPVVKSQNHEASFSKVLDGRKQPVLGLWKRNKRFYAQVQLEDFSTGMLRVRRVPLKNGDGEPVETVAQAIESLNSLRTHRTDGDLPKLGMTPTFTAYADIYLKTIKDGEKKKASTIEKEESIINLWKDHLGEIRLDKIRPAHVASFMNKRLAAGMSKRTAKLDIITLRNVLKDARDIEEHIQELPVPPGLNKKLNSVAPKRELFTPEELEKLCESAMAKNEDGTPVTKNAVEFCDYVRLMAYSGARRNEALALSWADVDFHGEKLTIERQAGAKVEKDETTKGKVGRTVDFNPALKKHLLEMKKRRAPDSQWLFPSPQRGKKDIHAMSFRESLELARAHAKMRQFGFHDLRHHFISYCVMSGIDFMTIAKWAGHKDGGILIGKVYGHLADTHTKQQAQRVTFQTEVKL